MPEISIVIPNYNTEKYLPRCLDSLINQTFKDIEIIVIDDGSKDNSVDVIQKYAKQDKRIKLIQQQNSGPAKARNQGLETAQGKYLMFCDSDDWYEPNMCQIMYDTIEKQKVDVVCCHNFFDWEENLDSQEKEERLVEKYYNPKKSGKYTLNDKTILSTNVLLWNKIWRRDLVEKYGIRFPEGHEHEDDAFWYMYAMITKNIFYLKTPLYHYFLRSGSIMSTQANKQPKNKMDRIAICDYVLNFIQKNNLFDLFKETIFKIYSLQFKNIRGYFSDKEKIELCQNLNKKFSGITEEAFVYVDDNLIPYFRVKPLWQLYLEKIWYNFQFLFSKNEQKRKRYKKKLKKTISLLEKNNELKNKNSYPIVFASDNNYSQHLGVTISSILKTNPNNNFHFYILDGGISKKNKKKLYLLKKIKSFKIDFIPINNDDFNGCPVPPNSHISLATFYRFKILSLFPNLKKILYLDCDLIVMGDLKPLFDLDLKDNFLAMVPDYYSKKLARERDIKNRDYYNAGVIMFNLPLCLKNDLEKKLFRYAVSHPDLVYGDQDVINAVVGEKILKIDSKYNMQFQPYEKGQGDNILKRINDIVILHYTSGLKPWKVNNIHALNCYYVKYLKYTSWRVDLLRIFYKRVLYFIYNYQKNSGKKEWKICNIPIFIKIHHKNPDYKTVHFLGICIFKSKKRSKQ